MLLLLLLLMLLLLLLMVVVVVFRALPRRPPGTSASTARPGRSTARRLAGSIWPVPVHRFNHERR